MSPKHFEFTLFGDVHGHKPYDFVGFRRRFSRAHRHAKDQRDKIHRRFGESKRRSLPLGSPCPPHFLSVVPGEECRAGGGYTHRYGTTTGMAQTGRLTHRYWIFRICTISLGLVAADRGRADPSRVDDSQVSVLFNTFVAQRPNGHSMLRSLAARH